MNSYRPRKEKPRPWGSKHRRGKSNEEKRKRDAGLPEFSECYTSLERGNTPAFLGHLRRYGTLLLQSAKRMWINSPIRGGRLAEPLAVGGQMQTATSLFLTAIVFAYLVAIGLGVVPV